ncbi:hypothetical protein BJ165DRAFT_1410187 [Panaeolus papilionaceus]|nr:hypothetical protein BJ165DRAFT_1410187 [Panaeolus papilionaceus]
MSTRYSSFLDLEAVVDRASGSGEDDEEDDLEDFINDYTLDVDEVPPHERHVWMNIAGGNEEAAEDEDERGEEDNESMEDTEDEDVEDVDNDTECKISHWEETHGVVVPHLPALLGVGPMWRVGFKAEWNDTITRILLSIPGALKSCQGLRRYSLTTREWDAIINTSTTFNLYSGDWIQITSGPYKGDPAIVKGFDPEQHPGLTLALVIPRIHLNKTSLRSRKRKRANAPPPFLFDPILFEEKTGRKARRDDDGHHSIGIFKFESGKAVILWSSRMHTLSQTSVAALSSRHLEVQGEDGVGLVNVLWGDILKDFVESDFVEVVAGPCAGRSGWILAILDNEATILDESTVLWDTAEEMQVHLNCLRSTVPNVGHTTPSQPKHLIPASHHHPWLNTAIVVVKSGCPWRTNSGCIRDVVRTQTASRICVRLSMFDPIHPFRDIWLESSDVVEQSTGLSIRDYFSKKSQPAAAEPNPLPAAVKDSTPGNATPAWSSEETASPNWPPLAPLFSPSHATNPPAPSHPLLSCSLLNAPLKVKLTGGSFNGMDVVISLKNISGTLRLFYTLRNKNTPVQPSWVTLRHPNPQRDNGLLVVVEGEHCGRFVHQIRHVDQTGGGMIIIVAAMEHVAGQPDKIDEELEFKPSELCVSEESAEDKKMNATLMSYIILRGHKGAKFKPNPKSNLRFGFNKICPRLNLEPEPQVRFSYTSTNLTVTPIFKPDRGLPPVSEYPSSKVSKIQGHHIPDVDFNVWDQIIAFHGALLRCADLRSPTEGVLGPEASATCSPRGSSLNLNHHDGKFPTPTAGNKEDDQCKLIRADKALYPRNERS